MLQEEAPSIAEALGMKVFKVSNGWLERFKGWCNLKQLTTSEETTSVSDVRNSFKLVQECERIDKGV